MKTTLDRLMAFIREEDGLTTVEYAVAGTLVALAVVTAFTNLGTAVGNAIDDIESVID